MKYNVGDVVVWDDNSHLFKPRFIKEDYFYYVEENGIECEESSNLYRYYSKLDGFILLSEYCKRRYGIEVDSLIIVYDDGELRVTKINRYSGYTISVTCDNDSTYFIDSVKSIKLIRDETINDILK